MVSIKKSRNEKYMLKGALRKNGFDHWRLETSGISSVTGEERTLFIEFFVVNPALSPKECILGFKSRFPRTAADLQYALAGTEAAKTSNAENFVQPSFFMVKAGIYAQNGKHVNAYFPCGSIEIGKTDFIIRAGTENEDGCILGSDFTKGNVTVARSQLSEMPELLCNAGSISWNLRFDRQIAFLPDYRNKNINWACLGAKTNFSGVITVDGEDFNIYPKISFGYYDKVWGRDFASPNIHLNSCNFTSKISGHKLEDSCFAAEGEFNGKLSVLASIEGRNIEFHADSHKKYTATYECTEVNGEDGSVRLHWSISIHNRQHVMDIDVFCDTSSMLLSDYESPCGGRKVLRVLAGGTGTGELRLYRKVHRTLELIEHAEIENCTCSYGNIELPEV